MRTPSPLSAMLVALVIFSVEALPAQSVHSTANYKLAEKYSRSFLRPFSYSTSVSPQWIGKSNRFWYSYRTSAGTNYWLVDAEARTKTPLFDHGQVAAAITEATEKAVDATKLSVSGIKFEKDGKTFKFNAAKLQFEYDRVNHSVKKLGKAPRGSGRATRGRGGRVNFQNMTREEIRKLMQERTRRQTETERGRGTGERGTRERGTGQRGTGERGTGQRGTGERGTGERSTGTSAGRSYTPDRSAFVFAKDHNLYYVEGEKLPTSISKATTPEKDDGAKVATTKLATDGSGKTKIAVVVKAKRVEEKGRGKETHGSVENVSLTKAENPPTKTTTTPPSPRFKYDVADAVQLSKDGVEDYSYGGANRAATTRGNQRNITRSTRRGRFKRGRFGSSRVSWSPDSAAFYTTRRDSRGLKDLFLVNSIATPRPTLQTFKYAMPGEERIRTTELHYFHRDIKKLMTVKPKWKDESYRNISWNKGSKRLRFIRRDRLLRNVEYCSLDPKTGKVTMLFREGSKDGFLKTQGIRSLENKKEFIWWSERTGWGQFYLYAEDGKLEHAITSGAFRASSIVSLDEKERVLYFRGNGREKGENIYYEHLYRVHFDGSGLTLLDPGDATHRSSISPSKRFVVDNWSRVDAAPVSALRDAEGSLIMPLETCDLSRLEEVGWKLPETFSVKAADGITNLYGNMWKPFDFDANKKYPIIVNVYPGPQQEGVTHTFSATSSRQQLAQIGFIVIQVGHRGGSPKRSRAYANYGYHNLRDYGLADKKAAIEQLAMRHSFIDIDRVGIYGHSGGGFMTGAALLQKPYNDFFKVGVASSGNHDNNIYNNSWSERYQGLEEVAVGAKKTATTKGTSGTGKSTDVGKSTVGTGKSTGAGEKTGTKKSSRRRRSSWRERLAERKRNGQTGGSGGVKAAENRTKFEIHVPTNAELAVNLKGHLLLVHGEIDNNVHPANTMRLVDALIKANKRFDMLIIPGARHGYGPAKDYFTHRMWEYFAEYLLGDRRVGADIRESGK